MGLRVAVFMTKVFARFARRAGLGRAELVRAAELVALGRWDADLGGGVFKQRIARRGGGKSGGYRTLVLFKIGGHSFFVHGFAKNERANIAVRELDALKGLARVLLGLDDEAIRRSIGAGEIEELAPDGEN